MKMATDCSVLKFLLTNTRLWCIQEWWFRVRSFKTVTVLEIFFLVRQEIDTFLKTLECRKVNTLQVAVAVHTIISGFGVFFIEFATCCINQVQLWYSKYFSLALSFWLKLKMPLSYNCVYFNIANSVYKSV